MINDSDVTRPLPRDEGAERLCEVPTVEPRRKI